MSSCVPTRDIELISTGQQGYHPEVMQKQPIAKTVSSESTASLNLPKFTLPIDVHPVLPSVESDLEDYLANVDGLTLYTNGKSNKFWPREQDAAGLYNTSVTAVKTAIAVDRNPTTGELLGFKEKNICDPSMTATKSMSLLRQPGPPDQALRGNSNNLPFWPGGLDVSSSDLLEQKETRTIVDLENDLQSCPPGLKSGMMSLPAKSLSSILSTSKRGTEFDSGQINIIDILSQTTDLDLIAGSTTKCTVSKEHQKQEGHKQLDSKVTEDLENLILTEDSSNTPAQRDTNNGSALTPAASNDKKKEEWAIAVNTNTPVHDFYRRVPDMAFKWPFELDVFQKQAILCLEQNQNVFVAAHTSAGKTVIAEYAIALCMRHMTKSIYTSPIKALSNQKFRDFKTTFGDVGLVTGDVQLNPEAFCLIMTTEILRSMLYNGSDTIRDLECVIFDEVHYVNDVDRGVVWEEVLIMLPEHVKIVLLSATVPNTMEFADWIGRIKRKHVYVVSTTKRPVPLEHYLYTGNSNKTSNELFCILDKNGHFLEHNYNKACLAKKERASKSSQTTGPKGPRTGAGGVQQEKAIWLSVIEMLRKKDKLPVVSFVFSRKRIDEISGRLQSTDLTTSREKSEIHVFFHKCVARLKGTDRELPQVKSMQGMLNRGLGIHHSGILPILREVVEMLFQKGLVKVLFATETFAMGVNMPARTVVFDSTRKHDGLNFRNLLPGEYVQMAGRSGRRGLDATGTVILLVKGDVPSVADLQKMMLGKPTHLESQFRLTYTMMLNLLRVEQLRVEDMMKRSFSEFHNQKNSAEQQQLLKDLLVSAANLPEVQDYSGDLQEYYEACEQYWQLKQELQATTMSHPATSKALTPGRVLHIDTHTHPHTLGVLLHTQGTQQSVEHRVYYVLVVTENSEREDQEKSPSAQEGIEYKYPRPMLPQDLFYPSGSGSCGHVVLELKSHQISDVTSTVLKQPAGKILDNWRQRQIPRFRNSPPSEATTVAIQELLRLIEDHPQGLPALDPVKDLKLRDLDLVEKYRQLEVMKERFTDRYRCIYDPLFKENFARLRDHMKIQRQVVKLKYLLSDESLQLLPEYQQRIEVLKGLNYIDATHTVQLKGRVACEMSNHELILTELLFNNALTSLHHTEIAALFSCIVFDMKNCDEPQLAPCLVEARDNFIGIATQIGELQKQCMLPIQVEDYVNQFKFGLMEVVFEWARGMPFCEITNLTLIQEGVIVRAIQRLDEVLRDVHKAARIIGDQVLCNKMQEAMTSIKRDIVFTASLYTQ